MPYTDNSADDIFNEPTKYTYNPRLTMPPASKFWNTTGHNGGISTCIEGNYCGSSAHTYNDVLKNCVGYAWGRFNEIGYGTAKFKTPAGVNKFIRVPGNPPKIVEDAWQYNLKTGNVPKLGALICWRYNKNHSQGHVAVVEKINQDGSIVTSESGYGDYYKIDPKRGYDFAVCTRPSSGGWVTISSYTAYNQGSKKNIGNWMKGDYTFIGFVYNPAVPDDASPGVQIPGDSSYPISISASVDDINSALASPSGAAYSPSRFEYEYETVTEQVLVKRARTVDYAGELNQTKSTNLLTYPTNVESPFILLKVGEFTFGTYNSKVSGSKLYVTYPNFIQNMKVTKVNGQLNQYEITLVYQIQKGNDPNLVDKIFSSIGYGTVKISYGDWNAPNFIYKEEEAIITKLSSNVDFSNAKIIYTLLCTSTALGLIANSYQFQPTKAKPSDVIKNVLFSTKYGLSQVFTGMKSWSQVTGNGWIATNDKVVDIEGKDSIDPLSYINYLVTCMISESNTGDNVLVDSSYYLTIVDDAFGEQGGPYFTIKEIKSNSKTIHNEDVYEVDVGYPSEAMVMSFSIHDDNSWSLLYKYSEEIKQDQYAYNIDNKGRLITEYSPSYSRSAKNFVTTPSQRTWWTQMTQFPISATLVIKGLLRPAMLMTYVKVNAFFFGQRHISSGLYFIVKQVDNIGPSGYRTTLSLIRFAGDEDAITTEVEERKYIKATAKEVSGSSGSGDGIARIDRETVINDPFKDNPSRYKPSWDGRGYIDMNDGTYREPTVMDYDVVIGEDGKEMYRVPSLVQDYNKEALKYGGL